MKSRVFFYCTLLASCPLSAQPYRGLNFGINGAPFTAYDTTLNRFYPSLGVDVGYQLTRFYFGFLGNTSLNYKTGRTGSEETIVADGIFDIGYMIPINDFIKWRNYVGGGFGIRNYYPDPISRPSEVNTGVSTLVRTEILVTIFETDNSSLAFGSYFQVLPRFFNKTNDELGFGLGFRLDYHVDIVSMFVDFADILKKLQRHRDTEKNTEK